ncbi:MAG: PfkB family carbohydrate kinase [Phototrophicaceae bacterium]
MSDISYLLIGTTTADLLDDRRILGGTVSYSASIVHRFGHDIRILTSAAVDEPLNKPLYDIADLHVVPAEHTSTFANIYTEAGRTQIVYHACADIKVEMLPEAWADSHLVHLAPLVNEVDFAFASKFPDATVLLTPQGFMRYWGDDGIVHFKRFLDNEVLEAIDILVLSKQDIIEAPDLEYEFPKYTKHVVVTDGENGGTYYHNGEAIPYAAYPVKETDPTGAGDVFASSLLASLPLLNNDMIAALKVAARMAAMAVTVKGAEITFTQADIQRVIQEAQENND